MFKEIVTARKSGYTLLDKGDGTWCMVSFKGVFTGSMRQTCVYSVIELGFNMGELEIGILEMDNNFHNAAEYGVLKTFMWSYDMEEKMQKFLAISLVLLVTGCSEPTQVGSFYKVKSGFYKDCTGRARADREGFLGQRTMLELQYNGRYEGLEFFYNRDLEKSQ